MNISAVQMAVKEPPRAVERVRTLPNALFCPHSCACPEAGKSGQRPLCEATHDMGVNVLALTIQQPITCSYRVSLGCGEVCCCPRHYAIYEKTGR